MGDGTSKPNQGCECVCVCTEKGQIKPAARAYPTVTERETEEDERGNQER